jgi:hypothetical protein
MKGDDKEPAEQFTTDLETMVDVFLDGMMSGISTTLLNIVPSENRNDAKRTAGYQLSLAAEDPAFIETIRDVIRKRMAGELDYEGTLLSVRHRDDD